MSKVDINQVKQVELDRQEQFECRVFVCASTGCISALSMEIIDALRETVASHDLQERVEVVQTGCMGLCASGPLVRVELAGQPPVLYETVDPMFGRLIVSEHIRPAIQQMDEGGVHVLPTFLQNKTVPLDIDFFACQQKVVLANAGEIDPESISAYIARDGYAAIRKVVTEMTPEQVVEEMRKSGLRGRGGGGFPVYRKWTFASQVEAERKYIICNGDEGDPGAYMDRSILEADPHAVLEGVLIAAYATGAHEGIFYIRAEYPLAIERMKKAIREAKRNKLLGKSILGTDFAFECQIRLGAGAFVCGEETALIASIEGRRGTPRPRPPYPSVRGVWDMPTCVNNVETLANVPHIIRNGGLWFAQWGTDSSRGTKVFALTGKVINAGLIEIPMGISLRDVVEKIGGGSSTAKIVKAVQTGGPSGGVIKRDDLDLPVCYEYFEEAGSIMGSGGMIVMDEDDSMVDIAAFYLGFTVDESCGKCAPCRIGGKQLLDLLLKMSKGEGVPEDIDSIKRICNSMRGASLCGLGQTAPNPVVSTLRYFEKEYLERLAVQPECEV